MEKIKGSRTLSFLVIAAVYLLALAVGAAVYFVLPGPVWLRLLAADAAATAVTFVFSTIFGNASVYDPYWSVQPPVILAAFAISRGVTTVNLFPLIAVSLWSVRLTGNWAYTFKDLNGEDWRYRDLREQTKKIFPFVNFLGIHLMPTIIVYLCVLPAVMLYEAGPAFSPFQLIFFALSLGAIALELAADLQMQRFRKTQKGLIRTGLWKYSRHPNYLGEILMWWGVGLYSVFVMPDHWYLLLGAAVNTALFLAVSIPLADRRQSKKPGYDEYRAETRMLLPIRKRRGREA